MSLVFSVPGKTFLAGEYLALSGGSTLVFLSKPNFETVIAKAKTSGEDQPLPPAQIEGIHPESPAGVFISKNPETFAGVDIKFKESYAGLGGFGASTAQFLAVYAFSQGEQEIDPMAMLEDYYEVAWSGEGQRPSGADLVGQLCGEFTFFKKSHNALDVKPWPFRDLDFHLVHTGNKIATHEHLKTLPSFDSAPLELAFSKIKKGFDKAQSGSFVEGIKEYAGALKSLQFTCVETQSLLEKIYSLPQVLAAKGCGALGADVVLVVFKKDPAKGQYQEQELEKFYTQNQLTLLTSSKKVSEGLTVRGHL